MAASSAKVVTVDDAFKVRATRNFKNDVKTVQLTLSKEVVQKKSSFLISHGKSPADAWEDKYGPEGTEDGAPFTKLLVLFETKKQDKAKDMAEALVAHYDKFFAKQLPAIKDTWLMAGAAKKGGFIPGLPPFFVFAAIKEAPSAPAPAAAAPAEAAPAGEGSG